jgi:lysozyme family protein
MISNFEQSLNLVLKSEGGFQSDPRDSGNRLADGRLGCTNLGVTQAAYEYYLKRRVTWDEMKALNRETVKPFYKDGYWDPCMCSYLPIGVDYLVFDIAVNAGDNRAERLLQETVGAVIDGQIGEKTLAAVATFDPKALIIKFSQVKAEWYKSLHNATYEQGWLNRVAEVQANALAML